MESMKRSHIIINAIALGALLILIAFAVIGAIRWIRVDSCLDSGGSWNYAEDKCEH